jgi:hypothetical protein
MAVTATLSHPLCNANTAPCNQSHTMGSLWTWLVAGTEREKMGKTGKKGIFLIGKHQKIELKYI